MIMIDKKILSLFSEIKDKIMWRELWGVRRVIYHHVLPMIHFWIRTSWQNPSIMIIVYSISFDRFYRALGGRFSFPPIHRWTVFTYSSIPTKLFNRMNSGVRLIYWLTVSLFQWDGLMFFILLILFVPLTSILLCMKKVLNTYGFR